MMNRIFLAWAVLMTLQSCSSDVIKLDDVFGEYCSNDAFSKRSDEKYVLNIDPRKTYNLSITNKKTGDIQKFSGKIEIYTEKKVERIELSGVCFGKTSGFCGNYPAEVLNSRNGILIVVEDKNGENIELHKCT